ncbi:MAG: signal peptidase II [Ilumatobacteraceae bacterium]|nr:signal peptidase II [Ilumatobacteraceae bacterium]
MNFLHRQLLIVAAATIIADLAAKAAAVRWLTDPVDLGVITVRATQNSGVAFGIGADQPFAIVAALTGVAVVAIAVAAWRGYMGGPVGAGLLVGGGIANLTDRLVGGSVVDLFDLGWWPVFNFADVALTVGVALIVFTSLRDDSTITVESAEENERV